MADKKFNIILQAKDKMSAVLARVGSRVERFSRSMKSLGIRMQAVGKKMARFGRSMTAFVTLPIVGGMTAAIKSVIDFETQLTKVGKTAGIEGAPLKKLGDGFVDLAINLGIAREKLLGFGEVAGQTGIKGSKNLLKFVEVMAMIESSTDIAGAEGALNISQLLNVLEGNTDNVEKFGNEIVNLGNNMSTTEGQILEMAVKVGAAVKQFDIGRQQTLAMSATLASLKQQPQAVATVFLNSFLMIEEAVKGGGKELRKLSGITGLSGKELKKTFQKDATIIFRKFVDGLSKAKQEGKVLADVLAEFGLVGKRNLKILPLLASDTTLLTKSFKLAGNAGKSLTDEFSKFRATKAARITALTERFKRLGLIIGEKLIPHFEKFLKEIEKVFTFLEAKPELLDTFIKLAAAAAILGPVFFILGTILSGLGNIIFLVFALGIIPILKFIAIAALVAAAAALIIKNWGSIKQFFSDLWDSPLFNLLQFTTGLNVLKDPAGPEEIKKNWGTLKTFFRDLFLGIIQSVTGFKLSAKGMEKIAKSLETPWTTFKNFMIGLYADIGAAQNAVFDELMLRLGELAGFAFFGGGAKNSGENGGKGFEKESGIVPIRSQGIGQLGQDVGTTTTSIINKTQTNNVKMTVDMKNVPKGTEVTVNKNENNSLNLNLGYSGT